MARECAAREPIRLRCPTGRARGEILNGDETTPGAEGALVASAGSLPAPATVGGARPGAGNPALTRTQRQARLKDRAAIERGRRPSVLQLIRRARVYPKAHRELVTIANATDDETLKARIWTVLLESSADAAVELLNRGGAPAIKALELRAFDDIGREIEREIERENAPIRRDVTPEMLDEANALISRALAMLSERKSDGKRPPLVYVRRGQASTNGIDVGFEDVKENGGAESAH